MRHTTLTALLMMGCPKPMPTTPEATDTDLPAAAPTWVEFSEELASIKGNRAPGMVAAAADASEVIALGAAGRRQRGQDGMVMPDDLFHLGSITKVYTALLVARLVDAGELSWDLQLGEVFNDIHPDWDAVTLQMLLRHEGGATPSIATDFTPLWTQMFNEGDSDVQATRATFAATVLAEAPTQAPGTVAYSNAGVMLVGAAIEAKRGVAWEDDLSAWVLEPLGQTDCVFGPPMGEHPWGHDAASGSPIDPTDIGADNPPALGPAGTLACSIRSLAELGQVYLKATAGDTSFLTADSLDVLTTANEAGFVPGMVRDDNQPWANGPTFVMNGSNTFWFSTIWMAPGIDRTYAVISNRATQEAMAANNDAVLFMLEQAY